MSGPKKLSKGFSYSERIELEKQLVAAEVPESLRRQVIGHTYGGPVSVDCVLCGSVISNAPGDWGFDPYPLAHTGECCKVCRRDKVVPAKRGLFDVLAAAIDASCRKAVREALEEREARRAGK